MIPRLLPMLAVPAEPFDSPEHLFEVKWDGVRAMAAVDQGDWQLWGREQADYRSRYPELEVLRRLPAGTLLDGELVLLREGRPCLEAILGRHERVDARKIQAASRTSPVTYVVFDLLYHAGRCMIDQPLRCRRAALEELLGRYGEPRLLFSQGIIGAGQAFFQAAVAQGQEGVMAKHLSGRYWPARRSSAWRKIKAHPLLPCVILGYTPSRGGFSGLLVAAPWQGVLQYVAQVTCGFSPATRAQLAPLLSQRIRHTPVVPCPKQATWVEPDLYCQIRFLQRTASGCLRGASFFGLLTS